MKYYLIFRNKTICTGLSIFLILSAFTACGKDTTENTQANAVNKQFEDFTETLFLEEVTANTLNLHYVIDDPDSFGISDYEISLGDFSKDARENATENLRQTLSEVLSYDFDALTLENQLTYDILVDYLNTQFSLSKYNLLEEPLSFSGGLQMELPILYAEYDFETEQDVKDYLKLIALTDEYFSQVMNLEAEKANKSLFMAPGLCQLVIDSCESFLAEREEHYLITSFLSRLERLNLSVQKKASYVRQNLAILEKQLFPAYESMIVELKKLKDAGKNNLGICYLENGKNYYEELVHAETGCDDSIDVLFRRIENQRMNDLLTCSKLQDANSNLIEECNSLRWDMADPKQMLNQLEVEIQKDFPKPPECNYEINYVNPALEEYLAPAFYIVSPIDRYTENVIYINNSDISSDIYAFTTLAHEGYPGHMYQTVMTYTYKLPNIRALLNYSGYVEGWATYIEMISYHYAGLKEDVASFLSHNQAATLSLYATSDIGLHYYGWTLEDLKAFWSGYGITNEDIVKQIAQLILSEPGNYLKYYIGYIEFLDLKEYAKEIFGSDYSDKQFHQAILDIGPAPFAILEKYLPKYYSPQT